jgi:hypothetical protein
MKHLSNMPFFNWLEAQLAELPAEYQELPADFGPVEEGEKVLGKMSQDNILLHGLLRSERGRVEALAKEHSETCSHDGGEACQSFQADAQERMQRADDLRSIFWTVMKHDFGRSNLKIKKDGQVVEVQEDQREGSSRIGGIIISGASIADVLGL